jgi:ABC-2 type transport system ATP-binding protein
MQAVPKRILSDELAVHTEGLVQRYGRETVLSGVDLTVPEGAVYVLVGPNGAGKTTLLKVLLNLVARSAGAVHVLGRDPVREGPEVRARVGWVPERPGAGPRGLTVENLLRLHAGFHPHDWAPPTPRA